MKRFASTIITIIVVAHVLPMNAMACGGVGGGYRGPSRSFYGPSAPIYRSAPVYRQPLVPQPILRQPAVRTISTQPQIRIAPTQRVQIAAMQPTQARTQPTQVRSSQPASQGTTPTQPSAAPQPSNSNVNSALAMLAGQQAPQSQTSNAPQTANVNETAKHVGMWTADVNGSTTIRLSLQGDGSFNWVATRDGKESRFDGQFTIADGTLTLARASDNQKLTGSMTFSENGFNFKLNGAKDSGLNFTQQT